MKRALAPFSLLLTFAIAACDGGGEVRLSADARMGADAIELDIRTSVGAQLVVRNRGEEVGSATADTEKLIISVPRDRLRRNERNYFEIEATLGSASKRYTASVALPTDPPGELTGEHGGRWLLLEPGEPPVEAAEDKPVEFEGDRLSVPFVDGKIWLKVRTDPDNVVTIGEQQLELDEGDGLLPFDLTAHYQRLPLSDALGISSERELPVHIVDGDERRETKLVISSLLDRAAQVGTFSSYLLPIAEGELPEGHQAARGEPSLLVYSPMFMDGAPAVYGDEGDSLRDADYVAVPKLTPERKLKTCRYTGGLTVKRKGVDAELIIYDVRTGEAKLSKTFKAKSKCDGVMRTFSDTEKLEYTEYPDANTMYGWAKEALTTLE